MSSYLNYGDPMMPYHHLHHHQLSTLRYDDLEHLRAELEQEDRSRESLEWSNGELERSIAELETYVRELDDNTRGIDDNEWKVRYESQVGLNKQMGEQKDWLETELAEARRKLTTGSYPEAMNFNLDALSEAELLRLVKHLERMRNDFYSTLRDTEWKLDKESKEFHHFDEMRRVYKQDLKHANGQLERMRLNILDSSGMVSSLYPPGYFQWLDTHTPTPAAGKSGFGGEGSKGAAGGSKSPSRKPAGSKVKGDRGERGERSPSRSPTRSKSRNEKKTKKKEEPPPEEATTTNRSETENENPTEEEEEEEPKPKAPPQKEGHGSPKKKHSIAEPTEGSSYEDKLPSPQRPKRESSKDRSNE